MGYYIRTWFAWIISAHQFCDIMSLVARRFKFDNGFEPLKMLYQTIDNLGWRYYPMKLYIYLYHRDQMNLFSLYEEMSLYRTSGKNTETKMPT